MATTHLTTTNLPRYHLTGCKPTKDTVETFCRALYSVARGKLSPVDPLGHLGLVISPAQYQTISPNNVAYVEPQQPAALNLINTMVSTTIWHYNPINGTSR